MKIKELSIGNFRCFDDLKVTMHPAFNVFIGNNATGKTAFLEAVTVALGGWIAGIGGLDSRPLRGDTDVRRQSFSHGQEVSFEPQYPTEIVVKAEVLGDDITWSRSLSKQGGDTRLSGGNIRDRAEAAASQVRSGVPLTLPIVSYYSAARLADSPSTKRQTQTSLNQTNLSRLEGYRDAITGGRVSPRTLALWLEYQDRMAYKEKTESQIYLTVLRAITANIPDAIDTRYDPKRTELVVRFQKGTAQPFSGLSDGQRGMAALVGDIAIRMARLNPHLKDKVLDLTPGVVLIDELDLHLHPQWQRRVIENLQRTFPRVQFLTTTHSPQVIGEADSAYVQAFVRKGEEAITMERPEQAFGLDSNSILRNVMETTDRDQGIINQSSYVFRLIQQRKLDTAEVEIANLRERINGNSEDIQRASSTVQRIRTMGR